MKHGMVLAIVGSLWFGVVACGRTFAESDENAPRPEEVEWLRQNAMPFATAEAGNGFDDLAPLRAIIGDTRIVALGEATHGTREFFQMKHRLVEFLATEMGFTVFSIEASTPEAYEVSDYAVHGEGDPKALISGMYFWTWNTEEVLAMVEWMKDFNTSGQGKIAFTGFDMQEPRVAMSIVTDFLASVAPDWAADVRGTYDEIEEAAPRGSKFGVVTYTFPIDHARGKHIVYRGYIRTQDVQDGRAGLWWRVDGANRKMLGFDNMMTRGPQGTTEWTQYSIEMDVAEEAVNINFGLLLTGSGTAWFDGVTVELDGTPYSGESLDLDFEGTDVKGYASRDNAYMTGFDNDNVRSGKQCLKMWSVVERDTAALEPAEAVRLSGGILSRLESRRDEWAARRDPAEVDWVIHNARIVNQCMQARADNYGLVRDRSMAENVEWIAEHNPGARIVLWAHNGHIARREGAMGAHLAKSFGDDYLPIAFAAGEGTYYAMGGESHDHIHALSPPPPGSLESFFSAVEEPRLLLDLRHAADGISADGNAADGKSTDPSARWLGEPRLFRSIGAMAMENQFHLSSVADWYDVLIYFEDTQPARQLDTAAGR